MEELRAEVDKHVDDAEYWANKAKFDDLTGLLKRDAFHIALTEMLDKADRQRFLSNRAGDIHTDVAVLVLDLDGFKEVNDTLGHLAGDVILIKIAEILEEIVREDDLICRTGGDEFAIALNQGIDIEGVEVVANRIMELVSHLSVGDFEPGSLGVSIGGAMNYIGADHESLLETADRRMYVAKRRGKNRAILSATSESAEE